MAGGADAGIRCLLLLAGPKREDFRIYQKVCHLFFVLFSRTYLKEDILPDCEQLLTPSGIEDQGGLHCETNGPAQIVLASFVDPAYL